MLRTGVCTLLGIRHPIIQGGMAHIATHQLVSAVSNAGGLGIIGAGHYQADWVAEQMQLTREHTDRPFGVNIILTSPFLLDVVELVIREKPSLVSFGAGDPTPYISRFKQAGIKIMPVVPSVSSARRMEEAGADLIVAEGMEAGGRVGNTSTMALVPQVVDSVRVPVVASGGIADGRGLVAVLALGAQAVQMGTRFVCSTECVAHADYKRKIVEAGDAATVVTRRTLGYPMRTLKNGLSNQFAELEKAGVPREALEMLDRDRTYLGLIAGDLEEGSLIAGQIAGLIKDIKPAKDIIGDIVAEAEEVMNKMRQEGN
jgi:enoyl-[acyl-carrier protein] reductase II